MSDSNLEAGIECDLPHVGPEVPALNDEKFMAGVHEAITEIERGEEGVPFSELKRKGRKL